MVNNALKLIASSILILCAACTSNESLYNRSEVEEKIIDSFKESLELEPKTKIAGSTLYLYIPTEKTILKIDRIKSSFLSEPKEKDKKENSSIDQQKPIISKAVNIKPLYLDLTHKNTQLTIRYAVKEIPQTKAFVEGITPSYTEHASQIINTVYYSLYAALTDDEQKFNFFRVYICDISQGMSIDMTISEKDLKRQAVGGFPMGEFQKRIVSRTIGSQKIIGDIEGSHVNYIDIKPIDFIIDLLIYRTYNYGITIKKNSNLEDTLAEMLFKMTTYYEFFGYTQLTLKDILENNTVHFSYEELEDRFLAN